MPHWIFFYYSHLLQITFFKSNLLISMVFCFPHISYLWMLRLLGRLFFLYSLYKCWCPLWWVYLSLLTLYRLFFISLISLHVFCITYMVVTSQNVSNPHFFSELQSYICSWLFYVISCMSHKHFRCNELKLYSLALTPELIPCSVIFLFLASGLTPSQLS